MRCAHCENWWLYGDAPGTLRVIYKRVRLALVESRFNLPSFHVSWINCCLTSKLLIPNDVSVCSCPHAATQERGLV